MLIGYVRAVFRHYFRSRCPFCARTGWIARSNERLRVHFPEFHGESRHKVACPVCVGREFAKRDVDYSTYLEGIERDLDDHPDMEPERKVKLEKIIANVTRLRCRSVNVARAWMGLGVVDEGVEVWKARERVYD
ncbi:uncharacterized protein BO80DRAFT_3220 [Aspergillus ibericus CBS 121593]|uniref:Uncharacterized protein n=1 Tax=Aspergillus ibericus CBS 121593 TaxID=1448316 RepID=A0A395HEA8_9EURO|nr:hypothetical protein BO80DRAFT_3220 [Aspergillus ibericus CBS 121593]RAL06197.1 hypothetical protein BO80DRAFT_3220 [Aspergillus ibericus CBS 121593]